MNTIQTEELSVREPMFWICVGDLYVESYSKKKLTLQLTSDIDDAQRFANSELERFANSSGLSIRSIVSYKQAAPTIKSLISELSMEEDDTADIPRSLSELLQIVDEHVDKTEHNQAFLRGVARALNLIQSSVVAQLNQARTATAA